MHPFEYALLIILPLAGGLLALRLRHLSPRVIKLVLAFSGAYLFGVTIIHLLPDAFHGSNRWAGAFVLIGFFLQIMLDFLSKGVEHGHMHVHRRQNTLFIWSIMIGLGFHAFMEGIPLGGADLLLEHHGHAHMDEATSRSLLFGIAVHKIPAAFALVSILVAGGFRTGKVLLLLLIFCLCSPLGAVLFEWTAHDGSSIFTRHFDLVLALVTGSFLHISTTIIFEISEQFHRFGFYRLVAIALGIFLAVVTLF